MNLITIESYMLVNVPITRLLKLKPHEISLLLEIIDIGFVVAV
jgi:hypothetical protein